MMYFNFFRFVSSKQTMFNPRSCLNQKKLRKNNAKLMSSKNGLEYSFLNILTRVFAHVIARELCHYQSKLVCSSHIYPSTHTQNKEFLELLQQSKMHLGHPVRMHGCIPSNDE